jgi:hypothetical protein
MGNGMREGRDSGGREHVGNMMGRNAVEGNWNWWSEERGQWDGKEGLCLLEVIAGNA